MSHVPQQSQIYVRLVRTIPPAAFVVFALTYWLVTGNDALVPALAIAAVSAFAFGPALILLGRRTSASLAAALAVPIDAVLAALLIATLDDPGNYAFGMLWPVVVACFVLTSWQTLLTLGVCVAAVVGIMLDDPAVQSAQLAITPMFVLLIGGALVALRHRQWLDARELDRSRTQLETAQRLSRSGSWEWNPLTDESYWSPELYAIFQLDPGEEMGLDVFVSFLHPDDRDRVREVVERGVASGDGYRFDATIVRRDGSHRTIETIGTVAQRDPDTGAALHLYGSVQDVTELREVDRLRSEFIATASHELRTPATVIVGFASTLEDRWEQFEDVQRREFVSQVNSAGQRLSRLIEDLLQASRIETGRMRVELDVVDVSDVVARSLAQHRGLDARPRRVDGSDAPLLAHADPDRLRQVLDNLLDNARLHTPKGCTAQVELSVEDGTVRIDVIDDGPGIDAADAERIFGRFVRLSIDDAAGTGLGLYISRELMHSQGGSLHVAPQRPDEGARFVMRLPAAPTSEVVDLQQ